MYWCNGGSGHIGTELKKGKELFECQVEERMGLGE